MRDDFVLKLLFGAVEPADEPLRALDQFAAGLQQRVDLVRTAGDLGTFAVLVRAGEDGLFG